MMRKTIMSKIVGVIGTKPPALWIIFISILSGLMSADAFYRSANTDLTGFPGRIIGICVFMGIDPNLRTSIYIKLILLFIITFCFIFFICLLLNHLWQNSKRNFPFSQETSTLSILSGTAIAVFMFMVVTRNTIYQNTLPFLAFLLFLVLIIINLKFIIYNFCNNQRISCFPKSETLIVSFIIPYQLILGYSAFFGKQPGFTLRFFILFIFLFIVFWLLYLASWKLLCIFKKNNPLKFNNAVINSGIPLILIPFFIPLANEIQFSLARIVFISPEYIAFVIFLLLVICSVFLFIYSTVNTGSLSRNIFSGFKFYFPITIATDALYLNYQHDITISVFDIFHTGEAVLPVHQLFKFGSIPFIDLYPVHGLFEMFPQFFYRLINGSRGFEMLLWGDGYMHGWIPGIIASILFFILLKKFTHPLFAFLILMCTPITHIFHPYYSLLILPALCLYHTMKSPSFSHMILCWIMLAFLLVWRIDFGVAATAGFFVVLAGEFVSRNRLHFKDMLFSFILVYGISALIFISLTALKNKSIIDLTIQYFNYAALQVPAVSYSSMIKSYNSLAILQYFILPMVSVTYILFYIIRVFIYNKTVDPLRQLLVYFAVISIIMSLRSLHRHSMYEGIFNPYLFVFLFSFLPFFMYRVKKSMTIWIFLIVSVGFYYIIPHTNKVFLPPKYTFSQIDKCPVPASNNTFFEFKPWNQHSRRETIRDNSLDNVVQFLNYYLDTKQMYYDFANAPLLYFLTDRQCPQYLPETLYHTSEVSQKYLLDGLSAYLDENRLPIVLFKQNNDHDRRDNVPNEIRSYRAVEFIYQHFSPLVQVDNFEIWGNDSFQTDKIMSDVALDVDKIKLYPLKLIQHPVTHDVRLIPDPIQLKIRCGVNNPFVERFLNLNPVGKLNPSKQYFLKAMCRVSKKGKLKVYFKFNNSHPDKLNRVPYDLTDTNKNSFRDIFIPVPLHTHDNVTLTDIRLSPPKGSVFEIKSIELVETDPEKLNFYNPLSIKPIEMIKYRQTFDLKKLPYIWGTYDDANPVDNAEVLHVFNESLPIKLSSHKSLFLSFPSTVDKSTGNYLYLCMESTNAGNVTVSYGPDLKSAFSLTVIPSGKSENYLIRISTQWKWMHYPISKLTIDSTAPVVVRSAKLLKGD